MRRFSFVEPSGSKVDGRDITACVTVSEQWIHTEYYPWWIEQCKKAQSRGSPNVGPDFGFLFEECLIDFCVVNWAHEI
jgi:hypothetical protein